jgi:hypothetical protein
LAGCMIAQQEHGRFGKGPFEGHVPDLCAGGALPFPDGFCSPLDEAAIRHAVLSPGQPVDIVDCIAHHERMESRGLCRRDLEPYLGSRARVAEVLNRKRPLSLEMIRRLHAGLGIEADILIQPYALATPAPNKGMQPTPRSLRSAPTSRRD